MLGTGLEDCRRVSSAYFFLIYPIELIWLNAIFHLL